MEPFWYLSQTKIIVHREVHGFNFVDGPQRLPQVLEEGPGWYATPCMSEMSKYDPPASQRSAMLTQISVLDPRGTCAAHPDEQRPGLLV